MNCGLAKQAKGYRSCPRPVFEYSGDARWSLSTADGTICVIHDHGRRKERMVLIPAFTEEDMVAGRPVSAWARLKILINRATGVIPDSDDWSRYKSKDDPNEPLIFTGI